MKVKFREYFFNTRTLAVLVIAATGIALLFHLFFLTRFPPILTDEPWYANAAWNWLVNGKNFDSMHAGVRDSALWPYLGNLPLLLSFAALGLGLFQARLVSWIFGALLLAVTILVGRKLYSLLTGALSALFIALSIPYLWSSHYVRPDIMLAMMGMLCFYLVILAFEKNRWWLHLLPGLIILVSLDIHLNAIIYALALGILYFIKYGWKVLRTPGSWLFLAGCLLGLSYYVFLIVLPDRSNFTNYFGLSMGTTHKVPLFSFELSTILQSLREEIGRYGFYDNSLNLTLVGAGMAYLFFRRTQPDRWLLVYIVTIFTGLTLLTANKEFIYAILLIPYFMIAAAEALISLVHKNYDSLPQRVFMVAVVVLFLFSSLAHIARPVWSHRQYDYDAITEKIKSAIPQDAQVMGLPHWWLGLSDYDYQSIINITYLHYLKGFSLTEGLNALKPDIIITESELESRLVDDGYFDDTTFQGIYLLPRQEFKQFLSQRGEKIQEFFDPWHGKFEIYRIDWAN